jgi:DNA-binding winged helix-turn-helix (wHTH) protein
MGPFGDSPRMLRFSVFEVDLWAVELRKHGVRIKLQEQPFKILALLLERPGELVTRDELRERLWSADTFVDFDRSLNKATNKLRSALGDLAESPRFIETLSSRGYRFIALISNQGDDGLGAPSAPHPLAWAALGYDENAKAESLGDFKRVQESASNAADKAQAAKASLLLT